MTQEKIWQPLDLVKVTADYLAGKSIPNPRLDAELLLCEIMGLKRRVDLYAGFEREISGKELAAYRELIRRRAAREPVSRILGRREFMGMTFKVTPDVLSPRPETELLVEAALEIFQPAKKPAEADAAGESEEAEPRSDADFVSTELEKLLDSYAEDIEDADQVDKEPVPAAAQAKSARPAPAVKKAPVPARKKEGPITAGRAIRALDLGTGSGCIAVALAAHLPGAGVVAVDASPKALAVAKQNAAACGVADRVEFRQSDWFAACRKGEQFDAVLSNPPYLVEGDPEIWPEVAAYDPPTALYGGGDGLDCYRRIVPEASAWLVPGGWIFLEVGAGQATKVADLLRSRGFESVATIKDYGGIERVVKGTMPA